MILQVHLTKPPNFSPPISMARNPSIRFNDSDEVVVFALPRGVPYITEMLHSMGIFPWFTLKESWIRWKIFHDSNSRHPSKNRTWTPSHWKQSIYYIYGKLEDLVNGQSWTKSDSTANGKKIGYRIPCLEIWLHCCKGVRYLSKESPVGMQTHLEHELKMIFRSVKASVINKSSVKIEGCFERIQQELRRPSHCSFLFWFPVSKTPWEVAEHLWFCTSEPWWFW